MSNKIFISYKYADENVQPLSPKISLQSSLSSSVGFSNPTPRQGLGLSAPVPQRGLGFSKSDIQQTLGFSTPPPWQGLGLSDPVHQRTRSSTTVRDYVDELEENVLKEQIQKWEKDGEDLSQFKEETIESKLRDRIYDSSITIVLISPNMIDRSEPETEQWIPWEIAYSLRSQSRQGRTSHPNAVLAVVLPDRNNQYDYYLKDGYCPCNGGHSIRFYVMETIFQILRDNMFNIANPVFARCSSRLPGTLYTGYYSYISSVKWCDFINDSNTYLEKAIEIRDNIEAYNICKEVK